MRVIVRVAAGVFPCSCSRSQNRVIMSMQPQPWPEVPAGTARVAKRAFRKGSLAMRARDELGAWYQDEAFRPLYGTRGAPGISPAQLAMVTVLQFTGNLTDRQAADAVRGRLDWKYCLGLELDDEGFDFSVLSEFRSRLVAGAMETALLEALLERLGALGLVGAGMPQRTDSTHVLGRIRDLNRLELAGETVRAALEALAAAAPGWLAGVIDASWQEIYGQRIDQFRLPDGKAKRADLAVRYGRDGYLLLRQVRDPGAPGWLRDLPAVQALRRIWIQQFCLDVSDGGEKVIWRGDEQGLPPARSRLVSPYDTDARYAEKRGKGWTGYKVHISETCHIPDAAGRRPAPDLLTNTETTLAPVTDVEMTEPVHDTLARRGLTPREHALDSGYASGELLLAARARGITLLAPLLPDSSPQARSGGYTAAMFTIDWENKQVTCPQGAVSSSWTPARSKGTNFILARFAKATCQPCPARARCTTAVRSGRQLGFRHRRIHEAVTAARAEQAGDAWQRRYRIRAGVEGTIAQATHVTGIRRARYLGLDKTRLEHNTAAAAINLIRLDAWWTGKPLDRTRTTHLQRLDLAALNRKYEHQLANRV
jgi:transposase